MSRRRVYREETLAIMQRFFQAIDAIVEAKVVRGVQTYCNEAEIDKRHLYAQKKDLNKGFFEVQWILPLIKTYNVSSDWLLFGKGAMFKAKK